MIVDFDKNKKKIVKPFRLEVFHRIWELLTVDSMGQRHCLQLYCNSHFKLKLKKKTVPTLSTSFKFHKIIKLQCQNINKLIQFKSHCIMQF